MLILNFIIFFFMNCWKSANERESYNLQISRNLDGKWTNWDLTCVWRVTWPRGSVRWTILISCDRHVIVSESGCIQFWETKCLNMYVIWKYQDLCDCCLQLFCSDPLVAYLGNYFERFDPMMWWWWIIRVGNEYFLNISKRF